MRHNIEQCNELKFINSLHNAYKAYLNSQLHSGNMNKALFFTKLNKSKEVRDSIILETSLKYR